MADKTLRIKISAETRDLQKELREAQRRLNHLATKGMKPAKLEARKLRAETRALKGQMRELSAQAARSRAAMKKSFVAIGQFAVLAGVAVAAGLTRSFKAFASFDKGMREVGTLSQFSAKQMRIMSSETKKMAMTFGQEIQKLTKARYDVVSAGFADITDQTKLLTQANKAAIAGVTDVSTATDLLTTTLNAYQMQAVKAEEASDIWFTTVRLGKTTLPELASSIGNLLPIANAGGVSLRELGAALATTTAAGISTPESVTAIRGAIKALASPTSAAAKEMQRLGIQTTNAEGKMLPLLDVIKQFKGMSMKELSKLIPDVRAQQAVLSLANNYEKFTANLNEFNETTGASEQAYKKMADSADRSLEKMASSWDVLKITMGKLSAPAALAGMGKITEIMTDWVGLLDKTERGTSRVKREFGMLDDEGGLLKGIDNWISSWGRETDIVLDKMTGEWIQYAELQKRQQQRMSDDAIKTINAVYARMSEGAGETKTEVGKNWKAMGNQMQTDLGKNINVMQTQLTIWGQQPIQKKVVLVVEGGPVPTEGKAKGGLIGFAAGGLAPSDTVFAGLTPGEFVINREATERWLPLLQAINRGMSQGGIVGYQEGGQVASNVNWQQLMAGLEQPRGAIAGPGIMPWKDIPLFGELLQMGEPGKEVGIAEMLMPSEEMDILTERLNAVQKTFGDFWEGVGKEGIEGAKALAAGGFDVMAQGMSDMIMGTDKAGKKFGRAMQGLVGEAAASFGQFLIKMGVGNLALGLIPGNQAALLAGAAQIAAGTALSVLGKGFSTAAGRGGGGGGGGGYNGGDYGGGGYGDIPSPETAKPMAGIIVNVNVEGSVVDSQAFVEEVVAPIMAEAVGRGVAASGEYNLNVRRD